MTLHLTPALLRQMLDHCQAAHPLEACGILPGRDGVPERHIPMFNTSDRPARRFAFSLEQQLRAWAEMDSAGEDPVVIYHSHTASEPAPSQTDRAHFRDPNIHYVIVGTCDTPGEWPRVRSWRYVDDSLAEEPIVVAARCG